MNKKTILCAMLLACASPLAAGAATATPLHDTALEAAAQRQLSERLGELDSLLRGSFSATEAPDYSAPSDKKETQADASDKQGSLPVLAERFSRMMPKIDRVIFTGSVAPVVRAAVFPALPSGSPYPNEGHAD